MAHTPTPAIEATKNDGVVPTGLLGGGETPTDQADAQSASVRGGADGNGNSIAEEGSAEREQ